MANHLHVLVRLDPPRVSSWSDEEVVRRWGRLHPKSVLARGGAPVKRGEAPPAELPDDVVAVIVRDRRLLAEYRRRLGSLSWFMKCLNEPIARQANAEDRCSGHFWEARFRSQPLRSEQALLAAMVYVDLNPVRARLAETPEDSEYTSIRARLQHDRQAPTRPGPVTRMLERGELRHFGLPIRPLLGFANRIERTDDTNAASDTLPVREADYLRLVDHTGRLIVEGKPGRLAPSVAPILDRIGLSHSEWVLVSTNFRQHYRGGTLRLRKVA